MLSKKISYWLASSVVMWCNIYIMSPSHTSKQVCLSFHFHGRCWLQRGLPSCRSRCGQPLDQKWKGTRFMALLEMAAQMLWCLQILFPPPSTSPLFLLTYSLCIRLDFLGTHSHSKTGSLILYVSMHILPSCQAVAWACWGRSKTMPGVSLCHSS